LNSTECDALLAQFSAGTCYCCPLKSQYSARHSGFKQQLFRLRDCLSWCLSSVTQFLWADVDIAPQVRLRQSTYAYFTVNYLPVLLKLEAKYLIQKCDITVQWATNCVVRDRALTNILHIELIYSCARHNQNLLALMNTFNLGWSI
jgi:hypothetical protein